MHTSRGSIPFTLSSVNSIATQIFSIICRCLFCQQSSKKGEIVRANSCPEGFGDCWAKTVEELICISSINRILGSWRLEFVLRSPKDNSEGVPAESIGEWRPPKMSLKDLGLSKEFATMRKLKLDQDLVFLLVSLLFYWVVGKPYYQEGFAS